MTKPSANKSSSKTFPKAAKAFSQTDVLRSILASKNFGAEAVMHDFAQRYKPVVATTLLHQLHLYAKGEVYREITNQDQLDEFYAAVNELLTAVYYFCEHDENVTDKLPGEGS